MLGVYSMKYDLPKSKSMGKASLKRQFIYKGSRIKDQLPNHNKITRMAFQWVYANGSYWVPLDIRAQRNIEALWSRNAANWIYTTIFPSPVYVDISQMVLIHGDFSYAIARTSR
jgi:hypothetical protein